MPKLDAGLLVPPGPAPQVVDQIVLAEKRGVPAIWSTSGTVSSDTLTTFAVAAAQTERIVLGASIIPTYPRHPFVTASEALAIEDFARGRFRLGIGPSHRPIIEGEFGIPMERPLRHLREYLTILRGLLWEGTIDFAGEFYTVSASIPDGVSPPRTPLPIAALRPASWKLAGEIADGAISWLNPVEYVVDRALPAMRTGAESVGRSRPPAIFQVPVAMTSDPVAARKAFRREFSYFGDLPFFVEMFADAGYTTDPDGQLSDRLIDELLVSGTVDQVHDRLLALRQRGVDELLISHVAVVDTDRELEALSAVLAER